MKSLAIFATLAAAGAWVLWAIRPTEYRHWVTISFEHPYLEFVFEVLIALSVGAILLLGLVAVQREMRGELLPWSANKLVRLQFFVAASAAVTGIFGIRHLIQMHSLLQGDWNVGNTFWFVASPVVAVALSPWVLFASAAIVASVAGKVAHRLVAAILAFDLFSTAYLAFVFANLGHWACVSCSGPLG